MMKADFMKYFLFLS